MRGLGAAGTAHVVQYIQMCACERGKAFEPELGTSGHSAGQTDRLPLRDGDFHPATTAMRVMRRTTANETTREVKKNKIVHRSLLSGVFEKTQEV